MKRNFSIKINKSYLHYLGLHLASLSLIIIANSCTQDNAVAKKIELEQAIWNIKENYPNHEERAQAVGLYYTKEEMHKVFIKVFGLSPEQSNNLFNPNGSLNMAKMKEFLAKNFVVLRLSDAFIIDMKAILTSKSYEKASKLFSLLSDYKHNLPVEYSPEEETEIIEEGLKEILKASAEAKDWEKRIDDLKKATLLDDTGQTDASKLVNSEISFNFNAFIDHVGLSILHGNKFGAMFAISHHPVSIDLTNVYSEIFSQRFTYLEYQGNNRDLVYAFSLKMVRKFLKEIQESVKKYPITDLRSQPCRSVSLTGSPLCDEVRVGDGANLKSIPIADPCFPYLLDDLVESWINGGLIQRDIANELKTIRADDITIIL
jgi:hypothetical protein